MLDWNQILITYTGLSAISVPSVGGISLVILQEIPTEVGDGGVVELPVKMHTKPSLHLY